ncbi:fluoride efflux transporter CrcB [Beijerinckia sp. L45]|uniref:fluoride efflux transporter CrcB n=1 Tax=Beijerinckia sp. L45 TaxID=1641855 RepID=UPI00131D6757|nr:fluoride efflux transporter CrcB [Beijerinckia sp. L45]
MLSYVWIGLGGAIGSIARFAVAGAIDRASPDPFPIGTVLVNVSGCLVIGFFAALTAPGGRYSVPGDVRTFVMVGLCGGYTTFSSFSLQTLVLFDLGDVFRAGLNVVASVVLCLLAVWVGSMLGHGLAPLKTP